MVHDNDICMTLSKKTTAASNMEVHVSHNDIQTKPFQICMFNKSIGYFKLFNYREYFPTV